ncbi:MAG: hypothetical protein ABIT71_13405 [Vicinamibacteraceae bacterium]
MLARVTIAILLSVLACGCTDWRDWLPPAPSSSDADAFLVALREHGAELPVECNGNLRRLQVIPAGMAEPETLRGWFQCLETARAPGRSAMLVLSQPDTISPTHDLPGPPFWILTGTVVLKDGRVEAFYYAASIGGRGGTLSYGRCTLPSAQVGGTGRFGVRCANQDAKGRVPLTRWPPVLYYGLAALAGEHPVNCNASMYPDFPADLLEPFRDDLGVALECVRAAVARREPFYVAVRAKRSHPRIINGLAGASSGGVRYFEYEDDASPGGTGSVPRFDVKPCVAPVVTNVPRDSANPGRYLGDVGCSSAASRPAPSSRPRPLP